MLIQRLVLSIVLLLSPGDEAFARRADAAVGPDGDEPRPDVLASDLIDWLRANDAYVNEKLVLRHVDPDDPSSVRGMFATRDMEAGETVCTIPPELIVKERDELMGDLPKELSFCGTIKAVMEATSGKDMTPYGRYLAAQPDGYLPKFWSEDAKDLLMDMLKSERAEELTEYDELPPHGVYDTVEELEKYCHGDVEDLVYMRAAMLVSARADYDAMVPFYDMINHHNGKYNVKHNINPYKSKSIYKEKGYEIVTTKAIKAGEELYNSYNHCNVCQDYYDHFGTPEMFLHFGFVEPLPQRWLFDFARVKFDLDWKDGDESSGEAVVNFLVPPSRRGLHLLSAERTRLELFKEEYGNEDTFDGYEDGVSRYEWESLWRYHDALYVALSHAVQSNVTLSDDVWELDDDWWVKDGPIKAESNHEHYVLPIKNGSARIMSTDEL